MTRKTTTQLLAEIQALFPDNNTGLISPNDLRTSLTNICDSFTPAFGALRGVPAVVANLTTTPAKLLLFDELVATSPGVVEANVANDEIVAVVASIMQFSVTASLSGTNNADVQIELRRNGTPTLWLALQTTTGAANRVEMSLSGYISANAGDVFTVYGSVLTGTSSTTFYNNALIMETVQQ